MFVAWLLIGLCGCGMACTEGFGFACCEFDFVDLGWLSCGWFDFVLRCGLGYVACGFM